MGARVFDDACSSSPGDLSGGRRPAGSSTKLRVWGGQIRDPKIATFGRRRAIKRFYRATGSPYAKTSSMAHHQWVLVPA